jgi:hypothetical protein
VPKQIILHYLPLIEIILVMPKSQTGSVVVILLVVILLLIVGGGAYYLGTQNASESVPYPLPSVSTSPEISATPIASTNSNIPSDWTYQTNKSCNVSIPIPPKAEPYTTNSFPGGGAADDNNRYWRFSEDTESSYYFFNDDVSAFYYPVDFNGLGNDYNPGSVHVFCAPNPQNLTVDQISAKLNQTLLNQDQETKIIDKGTRNKWGMDTKIINMQDSMLGDTDIYLFTNGNKMYYVYSFSGSTNQPVKDTTKQIFDNLKFSN